MQTTNKTGIVYLVGAGPGDPGLITVKGVDCIARADVVIYDYLASPALLAHANPNAEMIYVGKKGGSHTLPQEGINALIVEKAQAGKTVARLKGGDPFIFGRGGEEAEVLVADGAACRWDADAMPGDARTATPTAARIAIRFVFIVDLTVLKVESDRIPHDGPRAGGSYLLFAQGRSIAAVLLRKRNVHSVVDVNLVSLDDRRGTRAGNGPMRVRNARRRRGRTEM